MPTTLRVIAEPIRPLLFTGGFLSTFFCRLSLIDSELDLLLFSLSLLEGFAALESEILALLA